MGIGPSERERLAKESAIEQAEQERQRSQLLAQRLRAIGINPEDLLPEI